MPDLAYGEVYAMNRIEARRRPVETYEKTGSIRETARQWHTSRQVVRKWVRRYREEGEAGLRDRSHRPRHRPRRTSPEVEREVVEAWKKTGYGRHRPALYLAQQGLKISPHTIRHILRRHRPPQKRVRRKPLYPPSGPGVWRSPSPSSRSTSKRSPIRER